MEYSAGLAFYWMKNTDQLKKKSGKPDFSEVAKYNMVNKKAI